VSNSSYDWYVYIVRCADDSLYTGITRDLNERVATHNTGKGGRYTRSRLPVELVYSEAAKDRSIASRREHAIKSLPRPAKLELIGTATV
jgi:predicted GIY-YIG superfamily endonuclease